MEGNSVLRQVYAFVVDFERYWPFVVYDLIVF